MKKRISNSERSQKTTAQLVAIAREIFNSNGYSGTSLEEIVKQAEMTHGALYHHFDGKKGIFRAVFESALNDIAARIIQVDKRKLPVWERFIGCAYEFFSSCLDSKIQRIVLIDGPSVLGWEAWRKIDEEKTLGVLRAHLEELSKKGEIKPLPLEPLTHAISGAINESILFVAGSKDPIKTFDEAWSIINALLSSLRK